MRYECGIATRYHIQTYSGLRAGMLGRRTFVPMRHRMNVVSMWYDCRIQLEKPALGRRTMGICYLDRGTFRELLGNIWSKHVDYSNGD